MQQGLSDELYEHVHRYHDHPDFTPRERLAAEFAEQFAIDHRGIDDAMWGAHERTLQRRRTAGTDRHVRVLRRDGSGVPGARHRPRLRRAVEPRTVVSQMA